MQSIHTPSPRSPHSSALYGLLAAALGVALCAGCNLSDPNSDRTILLGEACPAEGDRLGELECVDGRWVHSPRSAREDMTSLDMRSLDMSAADMPPDTDLPPTCASQNVATFCASHSAQCGSLTAEDNCGVTRTVDCGTCREGQCLEDNSCSICQPEDDDAFCARFGAECGKAEGFDLCGEMREVTSCGSCTAPESCDEFTRICRCLREPDATFCARQNAECGTLSADDNCGESRAVDCGACNPGECMADNTCSICQAESDQELCDAQGATCDMLTLTDSCGTERTIDCGTCARGASCDSNTCICPVPKCPADGCGQIFNECGGSIDCGTCDTGTCDTMTNTCAGACTAESDAIFCARYGAECGSLTQTDNCGDMRTVADCGMCNGADTCQQNNQCG